MRLTGNIGSYIQGSQAFADGFHREGELLILVVDTDNLVADSPGRGNGVRGIVDRIGQARTVVDKGGYLEAVVFQDAVINVGNLAGNHAKQQRQNRKESSCLFHLVCSLNGFTKIRHRWICP